MKIRTESETKYILELSQQELDAMGQFIGKTSVRNRCEFGVSKENSELLFLIYQTIYAYLLETEDE